MKSDSMNSIIITDSSCNNYRNTHTQLQHGHIRDAYCYSSNNKSNNNSSKKKTHGSKNFTSRHFFKELHPSCSLVTTVQMDEKDIPSVVIAGKTHSDVAKLTYPVSM